MKLFNLGNRERKNIENYVRYSGMAFQMLTIVGLAIWLGMYLDKRLQTSQPYWTAALAILGVLVAIVLVIRDLLVRK